MRKMTNARIVIGSDGWWSWRDDEHTLRGLASDVRGLVPDLAVLVRSEYEDLARGEARKLAPELLTVAEDRLPTVLEAFQRRFPEQGRVAMVKALELHAERRVEELKALVDTDSRVALLKQTAVDYGVWNEPVTIWDDESVQHPAQDDESVQQPARFAFLTDGLGWMSPAAEIFEDQLLATAWEVDPNAARQVLEARDARAPGVESDAPMSPLSMDAAGAYEVLRVMVDVGAPAVAGAVAAKIVDVAVRWARDLLNARDSRDPGRERILVRIYAPDGSVLREVPVEPARRERWWRRRR
jgi:hypothetical protein